MRKRGFHWAWVILAVCFIDLFVNYSIRLGFGVVLPEMIRSLRLNRTQGGAIYNFYLAAYICLTPFTGHLTDRFGARKIITLFCIVLGAGTLLMGTVEHFWTAGIFFAFVGAGASAMWTPVLTVVQKWFGRRRRGMALGILSTGFGLGFATTGWLFPVLVSSFSWRFCWYALGAWALIMVLVNGILLRSGPEDLQMSPWGEEGNDLLENSNEKGLDKEGRYGEIFRSAQFWIIGVSYFFIACALYVVTTFMVDYANVELGLSFKDASFLATIHGLSQVVGVLTIPILSDRIGRRLTLMGSNVFIALSILGVIASAEGIPILFASIALLGIFYGVTWPMYGACGGDYFRKEVMGTVIGAWTPFYGLGAISAHFISGRIRDVTQSFQAAFYLAILFALVAAFLMQRVKKPDEES
ncbi:MAG TPA: MFS transporter [Anaerolineae bacterium]|nr:MFS transporter [Anaerolineae bacterium]